ncbi:hypothetical protein [Cryobacterium sp. Y50]|uniref:hypothetical protein n=1 Tax=Cryobacterium sp. Y50 TaxID=2048286 RepID=UPI0011B0B59E|nr:hypothetical protein [Cryobacterium sp. Y50]
MTDGISIVRTASGVEAVLRLMRSDKSIVLEVMAVSSEATREFDSVYERALERYLEASVRNGIRYAGTPPLSGAHVVLAEICVVAPVAMQSIGREVRSVGGTGSEWTTRWVWDLSGIESIDGELVVQTHVDETKLPLSRP